MEAEHEVAAKSCANGETVKKLNGFAATPLHPLQFKWVLWHYSCVKGKSWEECFNVVGTFQTVEDFWCFYNHIKSASRLANGGSYYLFKDGIKPMWEDEANRFGGRWAINFEMRNRKGLGDLWLEVLLCLIGEGFGVDGDDVCGAAVDIRFHHDRISIWTGDYKNEERVKRIGKNIQERLQLPKGMMCYESHQANAAKSGSAVKSLHNL